MAPAFDIAVAHRWFAVEANNRAWDLVELPSRTPADNSELIHVAHAALWHWQAVGTGLNRLRALELLVTAYCATGRTHEAKSYLNELLSQLADTPDHTMFDSACAHGAAAWTCQLAGDTAGSQRSGMLARKCLEHLTDPGEREVIEKIYGPILQGCSSG